MPHPPIHPVPEQRKQSATKTDRARNTRPGWINAIDTPFTCLGGARRRYALRPATETEQRVIYIEDMLYAFRPGDEHLAADEIIRRSAVLDAARLSYMGQIRMVRLSNALTDAIGDASWEDIARTITDSHAKTIGWATAAMQDGRGDPRIRLNMLKEADRQWQEFRWLGKYPMPRVLGAVPMLAGHAGTTPWEALTPWREAAVRRLGANDGDHLLDDVRRFPAHDPQGHRRFREARPIRSLIWIDRMRSQPCSGASPSPAPTRSSRTRRDCSAT